MFTVTSCCCGCSLKQGTIILMILSLVGSVFSLIATTSSDDFTLISLYVICALTCAFGLYGVNKGKPAYISPFLIYQSFSVLYVTFEFMLVLIVQSSYSMVRGYLIKVGKISPDLLAILTSMNEILFVVTLTLGVACVLQAYFFIVVYSFHKQFRANLNEPTITFP